jgi:hypothetical protein
MRSEPLDNLTQLWIKTLDARLALSPRSPVVALDNALARSRIEHKGVRPRAVIRVVGSPQPRFFLPDFSQEPTRDGQKAFTLKE